MNPDTLATHFRNLSTEHGFEISFHGLRHSCAIALLASGIDVKTAASVSVTRRGCCSPPTRTTSAAPTRPPANGSASG